ncbi:MAG TPA: pirin family protein [Bacteroidales bacterium]|nr:pirin family protein [Bacteroidales bacterium]
MEKALKNIATILDPPPYHMVGDGFRVHNFFPSQPQIGVQGMSPFFLMDYGAKWTVAPSEKQRGVGVHPHRGIETVTLAYHGKVAHHDSSGNSGIIGEGDVQWMTAGGGVLHKEYHEKEFSREGGLFQMVQLWINLPAKDKMTPARYQSIENNIMGKYISEVNDYSVDVIAGEYKGVAGPALTFSPVNLFNVRMLAGSSAEFSFPESYNSGILIVEGDLTINLSAKASENQYVYFGHNGENIVAKATSDSIILVMSGEPLNEPIAPHGPFVMNTREEIQKAYEDYYNGKFGYLED